MTRATRVARPVVTRYLASLAERVGTVFVVAFLGQLVVSGWFDVANVSRLTLLQHAGVAGAAAVLALVKGLAAAFVGNRATPSLLPASLDPATPATPVLVPPGPRDVAAGI